MIRKILPLALAFAGCADTGSQSNSRQAEPATIARMNADSAANRCAQFTRGGLKLNARSRAELHAEAGRPLKTEVVVEPNRHVPDRQDSIFVLDYANGLTVQIRKPGMGEDMVEHIIVTKRKWLNFPFFQPGVSADDVTAAMGPPQRREGENLVYICGGGEVEEPVVFRVSDGTVEAIVFNYYVD